MKPIIQQEINAAQQMINNAQQSVYTAQQGVNIAQQELIAILWKVNPNTKANHLALAIAKANTNA